MSTPANTPSPNGLRQARWYGAVALLVAFALGGGLTWLLLRERGTGVRLTIMATDQLPAELVRLGLTVEQRVQAQAAIRRGRDRVLRVVDTFDPAMRAAMDSTDLDIRRILSDAQRAAFDSARLVSGPPMRRKLMVKP